MVMINLMAAASKHNVETEWHSKNFAREQNNKLLYSASCTTGTGLKLMTKTYNLDTDYVWYDLCNYCICVMMTV